MKKQFYSVDSERSAWALFKRHPYLGYPMNDLPTILPCIRTYQGLIFIWEDRFYFLQYGFGDSDTRWEIGNINELTKDEVLEACFAFKGIIERDYKDAISRADYEYSKSLEKHSYFIDKVKCQQDKKLTILIVGKPCRKSQYRNAQEEWNANLPFMSENHGPGGASGSAD